MLAGVIIPVERKDVKLVEKVRAIVNPAHVVRSQSERISWPRNDSGDRMTSIPPPESGFLCGHELEV